VNLNLSRLLAFATVALTVLLFAASGGLTLGCSVGQIQVGRMFSLVLAPMIMSGCAHYPWSALKSFPILQKAMPVNPPVYACEGLRATLAPQFSHLPTIVVLPVLLVIDSVLLAAGPSRLQQKLSSGALTSCRRPSSAQHAIHQSVNAIN
jgi:hypothetical protein